MIGRHLPLVPSRPGLLARLRAALARMAHRQQLRTRISQLQLLLARPDLAPGMDSRTVMVYSALLAHLQAELAQVEQRP